MASTETRLSYKFQRLREEIRNAIGAGELRDKLPGERELARRFGVNAKTISKALTDLTSEGILVRQVGRGTFVSRGERGPSTPRRETVQKCIWLATADQDATFVSAMFDTARSRLQKHAIDLELETVSLSEDGQIPERVLSISRLRDISGVIVFSATPSMGFLSDLARRRIHFVLCNARSPIMKTNAVVADYATGALELTEHLILLGHERIQLVVDETDRHAAAQFRRGYQAAMTRYHIEPLSVVRCTVGDLRPILGLDSQLTALVCLGGSLTEFVKSHLERMGRTIPDHLSLVGMTAPGRLILQQQSVTSYDVYPDQLLDWAIQMVLDAAPAIPPREVIVPGNLVDRGSSLPVGGPKVLPATQHVVL